MVFDFASTLQIRPYKINTHVEDSQLTTTTSSHRMVCIPLFGKHNQSPQSLNILLNTVILQYLKRLLVVTSSLNRIPTEIFVKSEMTKSILPMPSSSLIHAEGKSSLLLQNLTIVYVQKLRLKMMIRQIHLVIQKVDSIQNQLHLPTWSFFTSETYELTQN